MDFQSAIEQLFKKNRRLVDGHQFTVPSSQTYPFQWLWDSCFHALILSHFDLPSAKAELRSVLSRPLPNGLLPHMIFWQKPGDPAINWGREFRGEHLNTLWKADGTSSITQPPVAAQTLWRLYGIDGDRSFLRELYSPLRQHCEYLASERTFAGDSLVYVINPDESGEDNSPRFDGGLGLMTRHTADESLDKRIILMEKNATCNFDAQTCMSSIFGVADVSFNVLYAEELLAMSCIAEELQHTEEAAKYAEQAAIVQCDILTTLRQGDVFLSYDHVHKKSIPVLTWNIFMPLFGGFLSPEEARVLVDTYLYNSTYFKSDFGIVTTAKNEESYDPGEGFWRGPIWIAPHWFLYQGLKRYGFLKEAADIKAMTERLLAQSGFREYYHPDTGAGMGAEDFTWGGLLLDMQ